MDIRYQIKLLLKFYIKHQGFTIYLFQISII